MYSCLADPKRKLFDLDVDIDRRAPVIHRSSADLGHCAVQRNACGCYAPNVNRRLSFSTAPSR
jgi:hypothetical protein